MDFLVILLPQLVPAAALFPLKFPFLPHETVLSLVARQGYHVTNHPRDLNGRKGRVFLERRIVKICAEL